MVQHVGNSVPWNANYEKYFNQNAHALKPPPGSRDILGLYRMTRDLLTFRQLRNWKAYLLALSAVHLVGHTYLFYRQYRHLQRSARPRVLHNVLTDSEFAAVRAHQLSSLRFRSVRDLWKLTVTSLVVTLDVLPKIWVNVDNFIWWDVMDRSISLPYEKTFGHSILLPLFYLACALLWTTLMAPSTFYDDCVLGTCPPKSEKQTPRQWINGILKTQFNYFWKVWLIIFLQEGRMDLYRACDGTFQDIFNSFQDIIALFIIYYLLVRPFVPARFMNLTPLRPGKTKSAIEALATELAFPLGTIYTFPRKDKYEDEVSISGWLGKRRVAITVDTLEKCSTEDVVALVAAEMGSWKHNPFQQLALKGLAFALLVTPIWILHFNWQFVTRSFGFKDTIFNQGCHPFQVLVLIYGGALDSLFHPINALIFDIMRVVDASAISAAVRRGYGMQLARAWIKLDKEKIELPVADPAYMKAFCGSRDLLAVVLTDLGWTGEEEMENEGEKGKLNDHWEMD